MKILSNIFFLFLIVSCAGNKSEEVPSFQEADLSVELLEIDSLLLDKEYFSGVGFFTLGRHQIFFVDQIFSTILTFDGPGNYTGTFLGKGEGPGEQENIHGFLPYGFEGDHLVLDNFQLVHFDQSFQQVEAYPIEWDYSESYETMLNAPKGSMLGLYEIDWKSKGENTPFFVWPTEKTILLPITMSHPALNGYVSDEYYRSVFLFGNYITENRKVTDGFGNRSEAYLKYRYIPNFDFLYASTRKDEILVSFGIDPLIHVYEINGKLRYKFGVSGKDMKLDYPQTTSIEEALDKYRVDLEKAGFYGHLYTDETNDLTFRTYFPEGKGKGFSRLQIYRRHTLVGDVQVPERFRVIGKIGDYYFADGIVDELNDRLGIYKFKL